MEEQVFCSSRVDEPETFAFGYQPFDDAFGPLFIFRLRRLNGHRLAFDCTWSPRLDELAPCVEGVPGEVNSSIELVPAWTAIDYRVTEHGDSYVIGVNIEVKPLLPRLVCQVCTHLAFTGAARSIACEDNKRKSKSIDGCLLTPSQPTFEDEMLLAVCKVGTNLQAWSL